MKRIRVLLMSVMAMFSIVAVAQDEALLWAEQLPQFPGGTNALAESIAANITYPDNCPSFDGKVIVQFVVTKTGDIGEVKVPRSVDPVLDSIAIAAVKKLPKFIPGQQDGKPVDVWFSLPIRFNTAELGESSQDNIAPSDTIFHSADCTEPPEFLDGPKALMEFIQKSFRYPEKAKEDCISGLIVAQFVVTKTGDIGEIKVLRSVSPELDAEAVRVCSILPKFKPASLNGEPVNAWYTLPFKINIKDPSMFGENDAESLYQMGAKYLLGLDSTPVDKKKAREYLERAAILGHQEARKLLQHAK